MKWRTGVFDFEQCPDFPEMSRISIVCPEIYEFLIEKLWKSAQKVIFICLHVQFSQTFFVLKYFEIRPEIWISNSSEHTHFDAMLDSILYPRGKEGNCSIMTFITNKKKTSRISAPLTAVSQEVAGSNYTQKSRDLFYYFVVLSFIRRFNIQVPRNQSIELNFFSSESCVYSTKFSLLSGTVGINRK